MKSFIESLNALHTNVWGFLCICIGTALVIHNNDNGGTGRDMIVGGFALISGSKLGGGAGGATNNASASANNITPNAVSYTSISPVSVIAPPDSGGQHNP